MTPQRKPKEETRWWIVVGSTKGEPIWHSIEYSKKDAKAFATAPRRFDYEMSIIEVRKVKEIKIRRAR